MEKKEEESQETEKKKENFFENFNECFASSFKGVQELKIMEILKGFKKNLKTIRDNLSETVRRENNEQIIPKNLLGCLNVQVATKLIEEAKNWDIDIEKKMVVLYGIYTIFRIRCFL